MTGLRGGFTMKKLISLVLALCILAVSAAALADSFVMGIDPEYPPFSYMGDDGEYTGFDVEICKAACEAAGLK